MNGNQIVVPAGLTGSEEILDYLQRNYGSAQWSNWQLQRKAYYSYVPYPVAGAAQLNFFGDALGNNGVTLQQTNPPKNNSFGQVHMLVKSIQMRYYVPNPELDSFNGTQAETIAADLIAGFAQAGVLLFNIGSRQYSTIPLPFQYCSSGMGEPKVISAGLQALTLAEAAPPTLTASRTGPANVELASRNKGKYVVDPNVLIEADQNFSMVLGFPSGLVPVLATGIINDTTNRLYVGVELDGLEFRPVQ